MYIHDSARKSRVANTFREFWSTAHKVLRKLSDWTFKVISMAGRELAVNVNRKKPCLNPESWQPRVPGKRTVQQYRVVCSKKPTVTIRSRLKFRLQLLRLVVDSWSCSIRPRTARKNGERWKSFRRLLMFVETPHGPPPYFSSSPS